MDIEKMQRLHADQHLPPEHSVAFASACYDNAMIIRILHQVIERYDNLMEIWAYRDRFGPEK